MNEMNKKKKISIHKKDRKQLEWKHLNLDDRILAAIKELKFEKPTPIQQRVIPLVLSGNDVLARAKTGSGKTAAVSIPVVQRLLQTELVRGVQALFLVPTVELGKQIEEHFTKILKCVGDSLSCYHVNSEEKPQVRKMRLREEPSILIGTPFQILRSLKEKEIVIKNTLKMLIIDEADFVLSDQKSHVNQMKNNHLPSIVQTILMSATLSKELKEAEGMLMTNPSVATLEDDESTGSIGKKVHQFFINAENNVKTTIQINKLAILFHLIKFKFTGGRVLVFCNDITTCYRIYAIIKKLGFTDLVVLSNEYPVLSRYDIIDRFNKGEFAVLLTTSNVIPKEGKEMKRNTLKTFEKKRMNKKKKKLISDETIKKVIELDEKANIDAYDMSRGIDFNRVAAVINYDVPKSEEAYVHQIGRTARGTNTGVAITFTESKYKEKWEEIKEDQKSKKNVIAEYPINWDDVDAYIYRLDTLVHQFWKDVRGMRADLLRSQVRKAVRLMKNMKKSSKTKQKESSKSNDLPSYLRPDDLEKDKVTEEAGLLETVKKPEKPKKILQKRKNIEDQQTDKETPIDLEELEHEENKKFKKEKKRKREEDDDVVDVEAEAREMMKKEAKRRKKRKK